MTVTTFEAAFGVAAGTHSLLHPLIHGLPFPSAVRGTHRLNRPHFAFARGVTTRVLSQFWHRKGGPGAPELVISAPHGLVLQVRREGSPACS